MKQVGKCPKCSGEMRSGRPSQDFRILKEGDLVGDRAEVLYCEYCGFVEFYKEPSSKEPKRLPKPVPEQEQPQQPAPVEEPRKPRDREVDKRLIR
jgi:predicted nucleic-acid-binding Zn-ribbon protein